MDNLDFHDLLSHTSHTTTCDQPRIKLDGANIITIIISSSSVASVVGDCETWFSATISWG